MIEWIKCSDRMPESDIVVIGCAKGIGVLHCDMVKMLGDNHKYAGCFVDTEGRICHLTHWAEINPPKD